MGDPKGFIKARRYPVVYRPACERIKDYDDVAVVRDENESRQQASRCMDCGTPFCHWGCPLGNYIPEWNDLVFSGKWDKAAELLNAVNNFPEITGRICPAACEYACVLGINDDPVTIRENELAIVERAFKSGIIKALPPAGRTGKRVAVVGSGPAGLACAVELNRAGHNVTVYERDKKPGGILRYGIPDFKLEKWIIDRRVALMKEEGVVFATSVEVGKDYPVKNLMKEYDAVCLTVGSRVPRDIGIEGRDLKGIHFAMDYLTENNRILAGESSKGEKYINASGKKVVVIGGGDTGSDCVGTANRQGASCVVQIEVMPKPSECRDSGQPWPYYPLILKTTSSHEEGVQREWKILTKKFIGEGSSVKKLKCVKVEFKQPKDKGTCPVMEEVSGSEFEIEADLVILAAGFIHPEHKALLDKIGVGYDKRGNIATDYKYKTSVDKVFAAGDARRGQSLVVWAISEGRCAAQSIDESLMGQSGL